MASSLCNIPSWSWHRTVLYHSKLLVRNWCADTQIMGLWEIREWEEFAWVFREENNPWDRHSVWPLAMALRTSPERFYVAAAAWGLAPQTPEGRWKEEITVTGKNNVYSEVLCVLGSMWKGVMLFRNVKMHSGPSNQFFPQPPWWYSSLDGALVEIYKTESLLPIQIFPKIKCIFQPQDLLDVWQGLDTHKSWLEVIYWKVFLFLLGKLD